MISQIHYVMGEKIHFTPDSMSKVKESLPNLRKISPGPYSPSSRVLGRQIKGAMKLLSGELTREVLVDLTWELKQKKPESWTLCLCIHLILCICVEELQASIDAFVNFKISEGAKDPKYVRDCGAEVCRRLEKKTLLHSSLLLDGVLKGILRNHNPFKNGCSINDESIQSQAQVVLIQELRQLISDHSKCSGVASSYVCLYELEGEVSEKAKDEYFGCSSQAGADKKGFHQRNTGRLLSKVFRRLV